MLKYSIDISKVNDAIQKYGNNTFGILESEFNKFGLNVVADAKRNAPVDEGNLRNSISAKTVSDGKEITTKVSVNVDYAAYVEFGTRKFAANQVSKLPSDWQTFAGSFKGGSGGGFQLLVKRITEWVIRKGIGGDRTASGKVSKSKKSNKAQQDAAYQIALNIARNGVKAQPYLFPAWEKNIVDLKRKLGIR